MSNNFKEAALPLLPYDLLQRKHCDCTSEKRNSDNISDTTVDRGKVASFETDKGIGKSGVRIR